MESDGWVVAETVSQTDRPDKRVYSVTPFGTDVLAAWLATPNDLEPVRSSLTVKMRAASYGDRAVLLENVRATRADHEVRRDHFRHLLTRDYPDPSVLTDQALDHYLVLQGGIRLEEFWIAFLTDYLEAHR